MMRQLLVFALSRVKQLKVTEADDGVDGLRKLATGIDPEIANGLALLEAQSDSTIDSLAMYFKRRLAS